MERGTYRSTLTFVVSAGMVTSALAVGQQPAMPGQPSAAGEPAACALEPAAAWAPELLPEAGSATSTPAPAPASVAGAAVAAKATAARQQQLPPHLPLPQQALQPVQALQQPGLCGFEHWRLGPVSSHGQHAAAPAALDDASPLSSSSRFMALQGAGSLTPSSVESCSQLVAELQQAQQARNVLLLRQHAVQQRARSQQQRLLPQGSSGSFTSSGGSFTSSGGSFTSSGPASSGSFTSSTTDPGMAAASYAAWAQLVQHQQQQVLLQQRFQQQRQRPPSRPPGSTGSLNSSSSVLQKRAASQLWQQHQQAAAAAQQQPAAKRAATQAAVTAMLQASAALQARLQQQQQQQQQQQLVLLAGARARAAKPAAPPPAPLPLALHHQAPARRGLEGGASRLLAWAGQVLGCQLHDAYLLAGHVFGRVAGRLDDMLLVSLGVTLPADSVAMLVSLWVASKLEGHRRQVAGASKLAGVLRLLPWAVLDVELHLMQLLNWQPYAGWAGLTGPAACSIQEL